MIIYAADDELMALGLVEDAVKEVVPNAEARFFNKSTELLEQAKEKAPDVVLLDVKMPKINGIDLAKELKSINPKVNIIFITGYNNYLSDAMAMFASGYIMKPFTNEQLKHQLENLRYPVEVAPKYKAICFGHFGFFKESTPISFHRSKSRELLAYLISMRGTVINRRELTFVLFEDESHSRASQKQLDAAASTLIDDLKEFGAEEILVKSSEGFAVKADLIKCDLYSYLDGNKSLYKGEYMEQYSWGEDFKALNLTE